MADIDLKVEETPEEKTQEATQAGQSVTAGDAVAFAAGEASAKAEAAEATAAAAEMTADQAGRDLERLESRLARIEERVEEALENVERAEVLALGVASAWAEDETEATQTDVETVVVQPRDEEQSPDAGEPEVRPLPDVRRSGEDRPHWSHRQKPWVRIGGSGQ